MSLISYIMSMPSDKRFSIEMTWGMIAYVTVLLVSIWVIKHHMDAGWRYLVAPLPMIPLIFVARASVARLGRLDELQKSIQYTALSVTVLVTAIVTLTYGFLENVGLPHINVLWVWPLMGFVWGITACIAQRRYQ